MKKHLFFSMLTVLLTLSSHNCFAQAVPTFNGTGMTDNGKGDYVYTGSLTKGQKCTFTNYADAGMEESWYVDRDFFTKNSDGSFTFIPETGDYTIYVNRSEMYIKVVPSKASLYLTAMNQIGKPIFHYGTNDYVGTLITGKMKNGTEFYPPIEANNFADANTGTVGGSLLYMPTKVGEDKILYLRSNEGDPTWAWHLYAVNLTKKTFHVAINSYNLGDMRSFCFTSDSTALLLPYDNKQADNSTTEPSIFKFLLSDSLSTASYGCLGIRARSVFCHPDGNSIYYISWENTGLYKCNAEGKAELVVNLGNMGDTGITAASWMGDTQAVLHPSGNYLYIFGGDFDRVMKLTYDWDKHAFNTTPTLLCGQIPFTTIKWNNITYGKGADVTFSHDNWGGTFAYNPDKAGSDDPYDFYLCDRLGCNIAKISPDGTVTRFAGDAGCKPGTTDGTPLQECLMYLPNTIAYDWETATFYFTETADNSLRYISRAGMPAAKIGEDKYKITLIGGDDLEFGKDAKFMVSDEETRVNPQKITVLANNLGIEAQGNYVVIKNVKDGTTYPIILDATDPANVLVYVEGTPTGVSNVILPAKDEDYYTISGQKVSKPSQRGIYIHNGKKFILK